jgi:hypothetical protein
MQFSSKIFDLHRRNSEDREMDEATIVLMLALFAATGAIIAWLAPDIPSGDMTIFLTVLALCGFGLAAFGPMLGDDGSVVVVAIFAGLGLLLALLSQRRLSRR